MGRAIPEKAKAKAKARAAESPSGQFAAEGAKPRWLASREEPSVHRGETLGAPSGTIPGQSKSQRVKRFGGARS
jgi:hypothetical protein